MLDRASHRRALDLLADTRSRYLATGAKWSDGVRDSLREFLGDLAAVVDPAPPKTATAGQLSAMFAALGVRPQS